jgi:hypothetical protein
MIKGSTKILVEVSCSNLECGKLFKKSLRDFNSAEKRGRGHYCSLGCAASRKNRMAGSSCASEAFLEAGRRKAEGARIREVGDENYMKAYFNQCARHCRRRNKKHGFEEMLNSRAIKSMWEAQNQKCMYSGLIMTPRLDGFDIPDINASSIDRKDSSRGYEEGNAQFVLLPINRMKGELSDEQFMELLAILRDYYMSGSLYGKRSNIERKHLSFFLRKQKIRNNEWELRYEELFRVWDKQNGLCPYSGVYLQPLKEWSRGVPGNNDPRFAASLDRIDSSRGYVEGNVQFISQSMNFSKHILPSTVFKEFLKKISFSPERKF